MKTKLNQAERNAQAFCAAINRTGSGSITIEWSRAGHPTLFSPTGAKCAHAGGGGYCKESTVLADALRFLFPPDSPEYMKIWTGGGAGVPSVQNRLAALGWALSNTGTGKSFDCYQIQRIGGAL